MKKNYSFLIILIVLFVLPMSCKNESGDSLKSKVVKVDTVRLAIGEMQRPYPGKIHAANDVKLAFRVAGPIKRFAVQEGQFVKKGSLLAQIDPRDYNIQLAATKAEYAQIKAEAERVIELHKRKSATDNDYDKAVAGLSRIEAKLNAHTNALADTRLLAPFDGYVQDKFFDANETVDAGLPILSMVNVAWMEVVVDIPSNDFVKRKDFNGYTCFSDLYPNHSFELSGLAINQKANLNQLYQLRLKLEPEEGFDLAPGMSVNVFIQSKDMVNTKVKIPMAAVWEEEGQSNVWLVSDGKVQKRKVKVVELHKDGSAVVSEGLKEGEIVVSAGVHHLNNGQEVKMLKQSSSTNVGGML